MIIDEIQIVIERISSGIESINTNKYALFNTIVTKENKIYGEYIAFNDVGILRYFHIELDDVTILSTEILSIKIEDIKEDDFILEQSIEEGLVQKIKDKMTPRLVKLMFSYEMAKNGFSYKFMFENFNNLLLNKLRKVEPCFFNQELPKYLINEFVSSKSLTKISKKMNSDLNLAYDIFSTKKEVENIEAASKTTLINKVLNKFSI